MLTAGEYLEISEGRYPLVGLGPRAREAATDEFRLYMKRQKKKPKEPRRSAAYAWDTALRDDSAKGLAGDSAPHAAAALDAESQRELFELLRQLRKRLADEEGVPPYIVFSDATLRNMCADCPRTEEEFLAVNGVGEVKLRRYGQVFLDEIAQYVG